MPKLSIIVPVYNEEQNVARLYEKVLAVCNENSYDYELIFIDDGSTDRTGEEIKKLSGAKYIRFRKNFGQTAAMMAGIDFSSGEIIIPMDGDLQNDPADIPRLLAKLEEGYEVVSGWRKDRKDNPIKRNLPSRIANGLISRISGVHLHDYGCSLKAYPSYRFMPIGWERGWRKCRLHITPAFMEFLNTEWKEFLK
jgi:glycosyltransferase involved in cell wall biosynthesis